MAIVSLRHPILQSILLLPPPGSGSPARSQGIRSRICSADLFAGTWEMDTVCAARKHPAYDEQHQHIAGVAAQLLEYSPVEIYANAHLFQKVTKAPALAGSKACQIGSQK